MATARKQVADVLLLRPSAAEVGSHGLNMMRPSGLHNVAQAAYEATAEALTTDRFRQVFADLTPVPLSARTDSRNRAKAM